MVKDNITEAGSAPLTPPFFFFFFTVHSVGGVAVSCQMTGHEVKLVTAFLVVIYLAEIQTLSSTDLINAAFYKSL